MGTTTEMHLESGERKETFRFNYKGMHRYIITLPAYKLRPVFTDSTVVLKVLDLLRESCEKHHFDIYAYCFLPDRLVMIARGKTEFADMKVFLSGFRSLAREALEPRLGHPVWKRTYLERVLRKKEDSRKIADEIFFLPVKAGLVAIAADHPFQGSFVLNPSRQVESRGGFPASGWKGKQKR